MKNPFLKICFILITALIILSTCDQGSSITSEPDQEPDDTEQVWEEVDIANAQWPISRDQEPNRIIIRDFNGDVLLDASK